MIKKFLRDNKVHKKIVPVFDSLFLLRPTLFFPVWIMITVGMAAAKMEFVRHQILISNFNYQTLALFAGFTLISGATFIINQIKDKDGDALNKKLFIVGNSITVEKAKLIQYVSLGLGVVSLLAAGISSFILGALLYLFWGILYNLQPFHFKKKPVLGMLTNSLAGLILYFAGWLHVFLGESASFSDALSSRFILIAIPYLLCYTAVSLLTTIPDIKGDRETGANTFPIQFGRLTTIILATLFVLGALALGLKLGDPISSTAAIVSLPFYLVACFRQDSDDILRSIRYSLLILAVFVMTIYPLLFPAVFIVFYLSKYYYWHRFDLHYPTFVMDHDQN